MVWAGSRVGRETPISYLVFVSSHITSPGGEGYHGHGEARDSMNPTKNISF